MPVITRMALKYFKTGSFAHTFDDPELHNTLEDKMHKRVTFFDAS